MPAATSQTEGTPAYNEALKEKLRIDLIYDAVAELKKIEQERPLKKKDIADKQKDVAAMAHAEQACDDRSSAMSVSLGLDDRLTCGRHFSHLVSMNVSLGLLRSSGEDFEARGAAGEGAQGHWRRLRVDFALLRMPPSSAAV
eukprot:6152197-Pleurochrysis_carterae.AAC.3